jgi:hypothetical protein
MPLVAAVHRCAGLHACVDNRRDTTFPSLGTQCFTAALRATISVGNALPLITLMMSRISPRRSTPGATTSIAVMATRSLASGTTYHTPKPAGSIGQDGVDRTSPYVLQKLRRSTDFCLSLRWLLWILSPPSFPRIGFKPAVTYPAGFFCHLMLHRM